MREIVVYTLMFSAMLQLLMAAYAWGRRNEPAAKPLILVFLLGCVWAFAYGMSIASNGLQTKTFWTQVYWTSASFGPLLFLLIVLGHLEMTHILTRWRMALLLLPSLLVLVLIWSIPHQDLLLYDLEVKQIGSLDMLQSKNGVLFIPILIILQGIALISYYHLIRSLFRTNRIKRKQSITILIALLVPFFANLPTILGINPINGLDFTPQALVLSSALFAFAIFRYRWLDILPLARTTLVEVIPDGVVVLDSKNRIVDINPSAQTFLQITDDMVGQESETAFARLNAILHLPTNLETFRKEIQIEEEENKYFDVRGMPLQNREGIFNGRIIMLHDITERRQAESDIQSANERLQKQLAEIESLHAQLHEQAIRDHLTGLFNRGYLNDMLERETHRAERHQHPLSMLMIEIDDFKRFNDAFGHVAGDVTLKKVAELIQANTRTDDIACRFGGDEFTLVLPETPLESAYQCAERLRKDAAGLQLFHEERPLGNLTLSIGVAVFPGNGDTGMKVLRAADEAMYRAKQAGKNQVVVTMVE